MCEDIEPVDLETTLLSQMDYAINFQNSKAGTSVQLLHHLSVLLLTSACSHYCPQSQFFKALGITNEDLLTDLKTAHPLQMVAVER